MDARSVVCFVGRYAYFVGALNSMPYVIENLNKVCWKI